jgi:4-hydroxysphinganine ceramide fatty acyl 2-hydroxylase
MKPNFVSNSQESTRMFKSNFLEMFSKIHFLTPLIIFVPVVCYFLYKSIFVFDLPVLGILMWFAAGVIVWSLTEYIMHRFLFHYQPTSDFGKRIHFIFHGVHHDYPNDAKRLVMAPAVSVPLAVLYYFLFRLIIGEYNVAPFFTGFVVGYIFYDMTHYAIHHFSFKSGIWMKIKKHHMVHHYKDHDHGYGVSSKFWDIIFRTDFKDPK